MTQHGGNEPNTIRIRQVARKTDTNADGEVTDTFWLMAEDGWAYQFVEGLTDLRIHPGRFES